METLQREALLTAKQRVAAVIILQCAFKPLDGDVTRKDLVEVAEERLAELGVEVADEAGALWKDLKGQAS